MRSNSAKGGHIILRVMVFAYVSKPACRSGLIVPIGIALGVISFAENRSVIAWAYMASLAAIAGAWAWGTAPADWQQENNADMLRMLFAWWGSSSIYAIIRWSQWEELTRHMAALTVDDIAQGSAYVLSVALTRWLALKARGRLQTDNHSLI